MSWRETGYLRNHFVRADVDGYVDDGREIFDEADEEGEEEEGVGGKVSGKRRRNTNIRKPGQPSAEQLAAKSKQRQFMTQFLASKPDGPGKKAAKEVRRVVPETLDSLRAGFFVYALHFR